MSGLAGKKLNADEWREVFRHVAERLPADRTWRVTVVGGVAMALGYGSSGSTDDADAADGAPEVFAAAAAVAPEFGLRADWLNRKAEEAGFLVPSVASDSKVVFSAPPLEVLAPSANYMLAMKVARYAGSTDINACKLLLARVGYFSSVEELWTHIGGLIPTASQLQARHNLETLWELTHESA